MAERSTSAGVPDSRHNSWAGRRVTVMGLGEFGGGLGAVRFLLNRGAQVTLTDLRSREQLAQPLSQFDVSQLAGLVLGHHREQDFTDADLVVANPAVKPGNHYIQLARDAGIPLSSEMNLFWELCPARRIVVTGTVGKSTTTTLIHLLLQELGLKTRLGGNIGVSLLPEVDQMDPGEWIVLELSSFQLADLGRLQPRPEISVVTNLFPNHLDWHGTLENYREAKQAALRWQTSAETAVLNADDPDVRNWPGGGRRVWFGRTAPNDTPGVTLREEFLLVRALGQEWDIPVSAFSRSLRHSHMLPNVAAALAAVSAAGDFNTLPRCGASLESAARRVCGAFQSLPHRMQLVGESHGRTFINDSKATTPEAACAALESIQQPVWLIAGGKDKGVDLSPLASCAVQRSQGIALMGETSAALAESLKACGATSVAICPSLEEAVRWCMSQSKPGDVILLSPGCASDGEFTNYEQRGHRFAELARRL